MSSADGVQLEKLTSLRAIVGEEAREQDLIALLARHNGDVEAAANTFFDHGIDGTAPAAAAPVQGTPPGLTSSLESPWRRLQAAERPAACAAC